MHLSTGYTHSPGASDVATQQYHLGLGFALVFKPVLSGSHPWRFQFNLHEVGSRHGIFFFFFFKLCHDWKTGPRQATTAGGDIATTSRLRKQRFLFHPRARCVSKRGKLLGGQGGLGKGEANSRNSLK